jgi:hypothetical protein
LVLSFLLASEMCFFFNQDRVQERSQTFATAEMCHSIL